MATFYIDSPSEGILELTSTTDIQIDERSSPTKHKLESGETITDNITNENISISFSGIISDVQALRQPSNQNDGKQANIYNDPVEGYISSLRRIRTSKELFTVRYDARLPAAKNCVITNISAVRDSESGLGYRITLSFDQVRISGRARTTITRATQLNPDLTQAGTDSGANNQEKIAEDGPSESLSLQLYKKGFSIADALLSEEETE